jgi:S-adenosylmethionine:tRNA-ribosyltransferase-isomerase (queuine synthetase)
MDVRDFDFDLPPELIAQEPPAERGGARLLHLDRESGAIAHTSVSALPHLLRSGDLIVVNNTKVFPARLLGRRDAQRRRRRVSVNPTPGIGVRPGSDSGQTKV